MKKVFVAFIAMLSLFGTSAFAVGNLTVAALDTTDFLSVAAAVLVASALMWGVKKGLGLIKA